jgi:hypothetical protein
MVVARAPRRQVAAANGQVGRSTQTKGSVRAATGGHGCGGEIILAHVSFHEPHPLGAVFFSWRIVWEQEKQVSLAAKFTAAILCA